MKDVPALILCGGFGTRLRPLTCLTPKQLLPLLGEPILFRMIRRLREDGMEKIILAMGIGAERTYRELRRRGLERDVILSQEERPLGTGGAIKKASDFIKDSEIFFVLNADIASEISYRDMLKQHLERGPEASIALRRVEDVTGFGVAVVKDHRIVEFVEKPPPEKAPSHLINAGVYILDQKVLDLIPEGVKISIEKEIFPGIAARGEMDGYLYDGLWYDLGNPKRYLEANLDFLRSYWERGIIPRRTLPGGERVELSGPILLLEGVELGRSSKIGPNVILGRNSKVGTGAIIQDSIIMDQVSIGEGSSLKGCLVANNTFIGASVTIQSGSVIGEWVEIDDGVTIGKDVRICPGKRVENDIGKGEKIL